MKPDTDQQDQKKQKNQKNLINGMLAAAMEAGREILAVYQGDIAVDYKEDQSPLTEADRRAHRVISAVLKQTAPDIPLLSEEGADIPYQTPYQERRGWDRYWLVDPLDGTKEFIKRNGEFTVNIALMEADPSSPGGRDRWVPAAGVVLAPEQGILYLGVGGEGAWKLELSSEALSSDALSGEGTKVTDDLIRRTGTPITGSPKDPAAPFAAVMSRSHNSPETEAFVARQEEIRGKARRVSRGSSLKLCLVAEGEADVYPRFAPTMEWDTAAGDAVCRAAGCTVTGQDGKNPLEYNKEDLHNPWFLVQGRRRKDP